MGHHINTGFALIATLLATVIGAILITVAHNNLNKITPQNTTADSAKNLSLWALILGYIAAGLLLILAFIYFTHEEGNPLFGSEWPHTVIFILIAGGIIASGILAILAGNDAKDAAASTDDDTLLYWGAGLMGLALLLIIVTGIWRAWHVGTVTEVKAKAMTYYDRVRGRQCVHQHRMTQDGKWVVDSQCEHQGMVVKPVTQHRTVTEQTGAGFKVPTVQPVTQTYQQTRYVPGSTVISGGDLARVAPGTPAPVYNPGVQV